MFKSIIKQKNAVESYETNMKLFYHILVLRLNGNDEVEAILPEYLTDGLLTYDGLERLLKDLSLDKFYAIVKPITQATNFIELINAIAKLKSSSQAIIASMKKEDRIELYDFTERLKQDTYIFDLVFDGYFTFGSNKFLKWLLAKNVTSKSRIAKEVDVDKKTLDKWLEFFFASKYKGKRKITLEDYFKIMLKLSLSKNENKTFISGNLEVYSERLNKDLVHNRTSLLEDESLEGLNEKSLKENLKLQGVDTDMKKIPYAIKQFFIEKIS